jgi:ribosome biogenesis protein MAK21
MSRHGKALMVLPKALKSLAVQKSKVENKNNAYHQVQFKKQDRWWMDEKESNEELAISPSSPWYSQMDSFPKEETQYSQNKLLQIVDQITTQLSKKYEQEVSQYNKRLESLGGNSDQKWLNNVIESGTWSDRVAALTLRIQESPFHNLRALDILIEMAGKKDPRVAMMAIEALRDLLVNNILPDRPLLNLSQQPLVHSKMTMKSGMLMWYEASLKGRVVKIIQAIDACLQSNVSHFRLQALETAQDLLTKKPEQESRLLEMIVNKTGDTEGKVNSKAFEMLNRLLQTHPAMKLILIKEVRNFIYRPSTKLITIFRAVNFLTNMKNRPNENDAVLQLAECYLSLFEKALSAKEEGSRLLSALLSGINRLFPLLNDVSSLFQYLDPIFKLIHTSLSWSTVTQALTLIANCVLVATDKDLPKNANIVSAGAQQSQEQLSKRYYRALYSTLLTDQAMTNRKEKEYLNLLFRSIKNDPILHRAMAFVKRISICAFHASPPLAAALLFMISELVQARPALKVMLSSVDAYVTEENEDNNDTTTRGEKDISLLGSYDAMKREPEFACWREKPPVLHELALLRHHFHPSVKAFANALLEPPEHGISFEGDPIEEFSLMAFLNRFAYKNPKEKHLQGLRQSGNAEDPVNIELLNQIQEEDASGGTQRAMVAPEKHFFYKYFGERESLRAIGKSKRATRQRRSVDDDSDDEDREDVDEEEEIDNFADELAEGLMRSDAAGRQEFFDEDDDEEDGNEDDKEDDEVDDDDDEDDFQLEQYHSSDDENVSSNKTGSNKKASRAVEKDDNFLDFKDFQKSKNKNKSAAVESDSEEFVDEEDEGDGGAGSSEEEMFADEGDEEEEVFHEVKETKKGKNGKNKRKREEEDADTGADFADADMYEAEMDEIINRYALNPANLDDAPKDSVVGETGEDFEDQSSGKKNKKSGNKNVSRGSEKPQKFYQRQIKKFRK